MTSKPSTSRENHIFGIDISIKHYYREGQRLGWVIGGILNHLEHGQVSWFYARASVPKCAA